MTTKERLEYVKTRLLQIKEPEVYMVGELFVLIEQKLLL